MIKNPGSETLDILSRISERREENSLVLMKQEASVLESSRLKGDREEARSLREIIRRMER